MVRLRYLTGVVFIAALLSLWMTGCSTDEGDDTPGSGAVDGYVVDAISGYGVANADITVGTESDVTDSLGYFSIEDIEEGSRGVEISCEGYVDFEGAVTIVADETVTQDFPLLPESTTEEYRIVLTWGLNPDDLDSHLWVPLGGGDYWHVYFSTDGSTTPTATGPRPSPSASTAARTTPATTTTRSGTSRATAPSRRQAPGSGSTTGTI
jgi:hypothetical protein